MPDITAETYDPLRGFKFVVTITNGGDIGFQKCSGLKEASDVVEYREGNMPIRKRKLPGLTNYEPLTFTRGAASPQVAGALLLWRKQVARYGFPDKSHDGAVWGDGQAGVVNTSANNGTGPGFRKFVEIALHDKGDNFVTPVRRWWAYRAWPSEYSVSDLNAEASEVLIETLVLQHEGLDPDPIGTSIGE